MKVRRRAPKPISICVQYKFNLVGKTPIRRALRAELYLSLHKKEIAHGFTVHTFDRIPIPDWLTPKTVKSIAGDIGIKMTIAKQDRKGWVIVFSRRHDDKDIEYLATRLNTAHDYLLRRLDDDRLRNPPRTG